MMSDSKPQGREDRRQEVTQRECCLLYTREYGMNRIHEAQHIRAQNAWAGVPVSSRKAGLKGEKGIVMNSSSYLTRTAQRRQSKRRPPEVHAACVRP